VAIIDENAHGFSMDYWKYLRDRHADIQMSRPKDTPEGGSWKYLKFPGMPAGVHVVHKFHRSDRNSMDLSFFGATTVGELRQRYSPLLDESMEIDAAGRSAVVRIRTPLIDWSLPFQPQVEAFECCIAAARRLNQVFSGGSG
jgi:hypothetical protein